MAERYVKTGKLGQGTFATVFKARDKEDNKEVAIKKIYLGSTHEARDGINRTALREIKLLQELRHENVINLLDVYGVESSIHLVFELMVTDLEELYKNVVLSFADIKSYILMTLKGLEYLHNNWILHRDLKPNNLLLDHNNVVKITDFGLSRMFGSPSRVYSHQVVTTWYKAPELLYGSRMYGTGIDIWSVGCILAELFMRNPLFPGESDLDMLDKIIKVLGTPTKSNWLGVDVLPDFVEFNDVVVGIPFSEIFSAVSQDALEILESMLRLCPTDRCNCTEALNMAYFKTEPYPTKPEFLPRHKEPEVKSEDPIPSGGLRLNVKLEPTNNFDVKPTKPKRLKLE